MSQQRNVAVYLRAQVDDYKRKMAEAAEATKGLGKATEQVEGDQRKLANMQMAASREMAAEMKRRRDEQLGAMREVGGALAGMGAVVVGVGLAAAKTGIQYNTLQQTSRAALTTLTGSAEAANRQMDKLDDFARNSPFAKQVFITAQQQMLGFGIEAEKVVPYLDAIQQSVAAFGGSNADIAAIAEVFSKVQAQGKITARELMQLGTSGIDAATLIGNAMGKTGDQIRADITAGSLDATTALDALAAGMQDRFGGAADNVKETFVGSLDRVKAAWRDLSSELASGLVGPEGGGALVGWLNGVADAMRKFQGLPEPVKIATGAIVGLSGAAMLVSGSAMLLFPRLVALYDAFDRMGRFGEIAQGSMRKVGGAMPGLAKAAGAAAAVTALVAAVDQLNQALTRDTAELGANALARSVQQIVDSGGDVSRLSAQFQGFGTFLGQEVVPGVNDLGTALDRVLVGKDWTEFGYLNQKFDDLLGRTSVWTSELEMVEERFASLDQTLATMAQSGQVETVRAALDAIYQEAEARGHSVELVSEMFKQTEDALIGVEDAAPPAAEALVEVGDAAEDAGEGAQSAQERLVDLADALSGSFVNPVGIYTDLVRKVAEETAAATDSAEDSWSDYFDDVTVGLAEFTQSLKDENDAIAEWQANLQTVAERGGVELMAEMASWGPEGARLVKEFAESSDEEFEKGMKEIERSIALGGEAQNMEWAKQLLVQEIIARDGAKATAEAISEELGIGVREVQRIAQEYGVAIAIGVNPVLTALGKARISAFSAPANSNRAYADGGVEDHVAQIAPAGAMRIWAEPETGGEAYIPLAPAKRPRSINLWRETGRRLGMDWQEFAGGGFWSEADVPRPYSTAPYKPPVSPPGDEAMGLLHDEAKAFIRDSFFTAPAGGGGSSTGLDAKFLGQFNAYNKALGNALRIVSGWRSSAQQARLFAQKGPALAARPGTSKHERGLAIDHAPNSTASMRATATRFGLKYPMGHEPWHVEPVWAAKGTILNPHVRDRGGPLLPGYTFNGTGGPETVVPGHAVPVGAVPGAPAAGGDIGAQVAEALAGWQPVVRIGQREFYGEMVDTRRRFEGR